MFQWSQPTGITSPSSYIAGYDRELRLAGFVSRHRVLLEAEAKQNIAQGPQICQVRVDAFADDVTVGRTQYLSDRKDFDGRSYCGL